MRYAFSKVDSLFVESYFHGLSAQPFSAANPPIRLLLFSLPAGGGFADFTVRRKSSAAEVVEHPAILHPYDGLPHESHSPNGEYRFPERISIIQGSAKNLCHMFAVRLDAGPFLGRMAHQGIVEDIPPFRRTTGWSATRRSRSRLMIHRVFLTF